MYNNGGATPLHGLILAGLALTSCVGSKSAEPADLAFAGQWRQIGTDEHGARVYVDQSQTMHPTDGKIRADFGMVDGNGRSIVRGLFDCAAGDVEILSTYGGEDVSGADTTDTGSASSAVLAYVCQGKNAPNGAGNPLATLPVHA